MDNKEVYLTISINYDGKSHTEKSTDFISFEDLKNISKNKFNIPEEDYKYMKLSFKNDSNNETILIENDSDIIFKSTEIDEYNYEMTIDLTIDKNTSIQIEEEKKDLIKEDQNENNNKEKKDEINNNKENIDIKDDNINMSDNNNELNKIINKDDKNEKKEKFFIFLTKLAIKKYKNIINGLENAINNEDNKKEDVLRKKENIIINENNQINIDNDNRNKNNDEKKLLKKKFEICQCNNLSFKRNLNININQLIKPEDKNKNSLKLILDDIKEKPQKFVKEMDKYNKKVKEELEKYFVNINKNFSLIIEKYKKIIDNYEKKQDIIIKELQEIKKQLNDKKNEEKINQIPNINNQDEKFIMNTPYGNKNVNQDMDKFLDNKNK